MLLNTTPLNTSQKILHYPIDGVFDIHKYYLDCKKKAIS